MSSGPPRNQPRAALGKKQRPEIVLNPDFRPNPNRAIFVNGVINETLVYSLTPQILRLLHEGQEPITVYIDSPGGQVSSAIAILRLLKSPVIGSETGRCRIITVTTKLAASAAAMLLAQGDYSIAYPHSLIHFHGVRTLQEKPITAEVATDLFEDLRESNSDSALALARSGIQTFFFRFVTLRSNFEDYRARHPNPITDKDCFIGMISQELSFLGMQVIQKAIDRYSRYEGLAARITKSAVISKHINAMQENGPTSTLLRRLDQESLKQIIAFEIANNKNNPDWSLAKEGLSQVNHDFNLFQEYIGKHRHAWIEEFCEQWKNFLLSPEDKAEIRKLSHDQQKAARITKLSPVLLPLWLFFGALCHVLQEEENPLTPIDAYWLGLIEEVAGSNLPSLRMVVENKPPLRKKATKKSASSPESTQV